MNNHQKYMNMALDMAKKAIKYDDVPIGAIVVDQAGNVLGKGYNQKEKLKNPTKHAEMIAIVNACKKFGDWRLENCIIYSTLEPCLMCLGTILQTRINWIVFGLESEKFGCIKTLDKLIQGKIFSYDIGYTYEFSLESKKILQSFFNRLRNQSDII